MKPPEHLVGVFLNYFLKHYLIQFNSVKLSNYYQINLYIHHYGK